MTPMNAIKHMRYYAKHGEMPAKAYRRSMASLQAFNPQYYKTETGERKLAPPGGPRIMHRAEMEKLGFFSGKNGGAARQTARAVARRTARRVTRRTTRGFGYGSSAVMRRTSRGITRTTTRRTARGTVSRTRRRRTRKSPKTLLGYLFGGNILAEEGFGGTRTRAGIRRRRLRATF